ncbi:PREDICTED: probable cytochrome P450 304a1, partial [Nicrophorus vespilloides]|uniref:Probable cytochrome P450 304a1 n=1 Tax=Nicrophorus vespilloides TaxID=110193 RepID=A0ABM1M4A5_NICVS
MILFALLFIFAIGLLLFHIYKDNSTRPPNFPPGPPKIPTFGSYFFIKKENFYPHKAFVSLGKKYKTDVVGFYIGPFLAATCYKYDVLKEVLSREEFSGRPDGPIVRNRGLGKKLGIFFSDEQYWKDQRWFSLRHLRDFGFGRRDVNIEQVITDEVKGMIELCTSKPQPKDADMCTQQGIVKLPDLFYGATLNCVHHSLSARHFDDYAELRMVGRAADKFMKIIDSTGCCITVAPWLRHLAPEYFGWNASFREQAVLIKFARKIVKEHKETYIEGFHRDFVDVYLSEMNYLKTNRKVNTSFSGEIFTFLHRSMLYISGSQTFLCRRPLAMFFSFGGSTLILIF